MNRIVTFLSGALVVAILALGARVSVASEMDEIAEEYVKLVLAVGEHDAGYVDAYYGPEEWRADMKDRALSLAAILARASELHQQLSRLNSSDEVEIVVLRHQYLLKQMEAMIAYTRMLDGKTMTFDEESAALYDAVAPTHPASYFQSAIDRLDMLLPGEGPVAERLAVFRSEFTIPVDKLDAVFTAAIAECRARTRLRIELPKNERFEVEYVTDKPWSAYNWYKGNGYSLIQVNTEFPIGISRAIDLACHEGYPGHHVYNALLEQHLVKERNWVEFSVYPLFSPQSLIAEGTANFGIEVAFPNEDRVIFEKNVLFPLAGIDPDRTELYYEVEEVMNTMSYAGNEAARLYLNGDASKEETLNWLVENALSSPERAQQRVRFFDTYRSYVINYNLGQDLVRSYINGRGGVAGDSDKRWSEFKRLISSPRLPSGLTPQP